MKLRPLVLVAGVALPFYYLSFLYVLGIQWSGYSFTSQQMSELGGVGAPHRLIMNLAGFTLTGLVILGVGFYKRSSDVNWLDRAATILTLVAGLSFLPIAYFNCDTGCIDVTTTGRLHSYFAMVPAMVMPSAAILHGFSLNLKAKKATKAAAISIALGILSFLGGSLMSIPALEDYLGLFQRLGMFFSLLWISYISVIILRVIKGEKSIN